MPTDAGSIVIFVVLISLILVLLALILVGLLYVYKKKQNLYLQKLTAIRLESEKHVLSARIEMQENTFQEIGREIHDNVNLSLTVARIYLELFKREINENNTVRLDDATQIVSGAIATLRDMSKSFSSELLHTRGLVVAVEQEIERIRKTGLFEIELDISEDVPYMDTQKELVVFRIIQESFNNIIRHSKATRAFLSIDVKDQNLVITISDNGMGFDAKDQLANKIGTGLSNIQVRVKFIGGTFTLDSSNGKGTVVKIAIPF